VDVVGAAVVLAEVGGTYFLGSGCCCSVVDVEFKVLLDFVLIVAEMADVVPADVVLPNCPTGLPFCCSDWSCCR
jgi:hypothetical protein